MNTLDSQWQKKINEIIFEKSFIPANQDQSTLRDQDLGRGHCCYPPFTPGFNFQGINVAPFTNTELEPGGCFPSIHSTKSTVV